LEVSDGPRVLVLLCVLSRLGQVVRFSEAPLKRASSLCVCVTGSFVNERRDILLRRGAVFGKARIYHQMVGKRHCPFYDSLPYGTCGSNNRIRPALLARLSYWELGYALIRPVLIILSLPIQLLTLGLFTLDNKRLHAVDSVQGGPGFLHIRVLARCWRQYSSQ